MTKVFVTPLFVLALLVPSLAEAQQKSASDQRSLKLAINPQAATDCNLCLTCGGDWPIFAGSWLSSGVNNVTERGGSCSGPLLSRTDSRPFLCCGD